MSHPRVLIVSARLGGGHDGAARAIADRLAAHEVHTHIVDFLDASPRLGSMIETVFRVEVERAPWAYRLEFELWSHVPALTHVARRLFRRFFSEQLTRWIESYDPDLIIATHPFPAQLLGELRVRGHPAVRQRVLATFLTDFSVHPMWVHPAIDVHLAVSDSAAVQAKRRGHLRGPVRRVGPFVDPRFHAVGDRARARREPGLPDQATLALIVGGAWGVGKLVETARSLASSSEVTPVVLCGRNDDLLRRVEAIPGAIAVGWTTRVDHWLAACDAVVQNAGGLSSLEAMAAGRPVISYEPIVGHGEENVAAMAASGVTFWARSNRELLDAVTHFAKHPTELTLPALEQFSASPEDAILSLLTERVTIARRPRRRALSRHLLEAVGALGTLFIGANLVSGLIGYQGLNLVAEARPTHLVYLAVLVAPQALGDTAVEHALLHDHAAAVVTSRAATSDPGAIAQAAAVGVPIVNGGAGSRIGDLSLIVPVNDLKLGRQAIAAAIGSPVNVYVPQNTINAVDLAWAAMHHQSVVPAHIVPPARTSAAIAGGAVVEVAAPHATTTGVLSLLSQLGALLGRRHLRAEPVSDLARAPEVSA